MKRMDLNRRDFNKLTMAAFGGLLAGTAAGCGSGEPEANPAPETGAADGAGETDGAEPAGGEPVAETGNPLLSEPHVCRGLNTCKNKGASGENACAGQGTCATAVAHSCHYENACRGQGGCGEKPGQNACKGMGECAVPLGESAWEKARSAFEQAMKEAGKEVGPAPSA